MDGVDINRKLAFTPGRARVAAGGTHLTSPRRMFNFSALSRFSKPSKVARPAAPAAEVAEAAIAAAGDMSAGEVGKPAEPERVVEVPAIDVDAGDVAVSEEAACGKTLVEAVMNKALLEACSHDDGHEPEEGSCQAHAPCSACHQRLEQAHPCWRKSARSALKHRCYLPRLATSVRLPGW